MTPLFSKYKDEHETRYKILGFTIYLRQHHRDSVIIEEPEQSNPFKERVSIGKYSYGPIDVDICGNGKEKLIIGNFCSIANHVKFILESEHPYKGFSSYPFKVKILNHDNEAQSKGDIVIKDDVWIGYGCVVLSGITIGQGAIIAAGSVLTKNVEPYSIVAGNPAKHIKYRFEKSIREKLEKIDFSQLNEEQIIAAQDYLYKELTEDNIDEILHAIFNGSNFLQMR